MKPDLHPRFQKWFAEQTPETQGAIWAKWAEFSQHEEVNHVAKTRLEDWLAKQPVAVREQKTPESQRALADYSRQVQSKAHYWIDTHTMKWCAETYGYDYSA